MQMSRLLKYGMKNNKLKLNVKFGHFLLASNVDSCALFISLLVKEESWKNMGNVGFLWRIFSENMKQVID